jgi:zinc transporter ZupT
MGFVNHNTLAQISFIMPIQPWELALATGVLLFVVSDKMIPENHRRRVRAESNLWFDQRIHIEMMHLDCVST